MIYRTKSNCSSLALALSTVAVALCIHAGAPHATAAEVTFDLVASASTDNGGGFPSEVSTINNSGEVALLRNALVDDVLTRMVQKIIIPGSAPLVLAQDGQQAPGISGFEFNFFGSGFDAPPTLGFPVINDAGQVAFHARALNPGVTSLWGIWATGTDSVLRKVAVEGEAAPGTSSQFIEFQDLPAFNNPIDGQPAQVAFGAKVDGLGSSGGIWVGEPGGPLVNVVFDGDNAPGRSDQFVIKPALFPNTSNPAINGNGQVAFGANTTTGSGIWAGLPGALAKVVSNDEPAPGTSNPFIRFPVTSYESSVALNNDGQVAFRAVTNTAGNNATESGIWVGTPGVSGYDLNKIVLTGDQTGISGVTFNNLSFGSEPVINRRGDVAFSADLDDSTSGIWLSKSGSSTPTLIAREGDVAPGTGGAVFTSFGSFGPGAEDRSPLLNNARQVVFEATADHVFGIWAWTDAGLVPIAFGIPEQGIGFFGLLSSGGEDGRGRMLSDAGVLVYKASTSFGEFIITATIPIFGDLNGDGFVGIDDLNLLFANWNQTVPPADPLADPSGDGFVGIGDLNIVLSNWNAGVPPGGGSGVPEPASLALLGLGGLAMLRRRSA